MTTFGGDVSSHPGSLAAYKSAGGQFLIARCVTEPCTVDPAYAPTVADAEAAGMLAGGYDFLTGDFAGHTVEQRAELFISSLGPPANRIAMLDVERPGFPTLHPAPTPNDVNRWMKVWRAHYPNHPVLLYLPRWYWSGWTARPDLHTVGPLVASNYTDGWTSFAGYTAGHGDTNTVWTTGYAGFSGPSLWQYAGSVKTYGFGADLTAFRGTMDQLRTLCLGTTGGEMNATQTVTVLGAPNPRKWVVAAGVTLSGYSVTKPGVAQKTSTFTAASSAHADAEVHVDWTNADGTPVAAPPSPNGGPFLRVTDGTYAGLLIVKALVTLDPATPAYTDADLKTNYNSGVAAAQKAAGTATKP